MRVFSVFELDTARSSRKTSVVAWTNSEWREHDATSESVEPKPKGEGTVWQRACLN